MRLLYLYVADYRIFSEEHPLEVNFTTNFRFKIDFKGSEKVLVVNKTRSGIPNDFFNNGCACGNVTEISAIVGRNGSGKTSIAALFQRLRMVDAGKVPFVCVVEIGNDNPGMPKGWYLVSSISNLKQPTGKTVKQGFSWRASPGDILPCEDRLRLLFDYIYFSPHYTTENPFDFHDDPSCCNLSTSYLRERRPEYYLNVLESGGCSSARFARSFVAEQRQWVLRFVRELARVTKYAQSEIKIPLPQTIFVCSSVDHLTVARDEFTRILGRSRNLRSEGVLVSKEGRALCKDILQLLDKYEGAGGFLSAILGFVCSYGRSIISAPSVIINSRDGFIKQVVQYLKKATTEVNPSEFLERLKRWRVNTQHELLDDNQFAALELVMERLARGKPHAVGWMLALETAEEFVQNYDSIGLLTDFLTFTFHPVLSSGEMSYLSLFSRLHWALTKRNGEGNKNLLIFLDEIEVTLHPAWQQQLVYSLIWFADHFAKRRSIHYVLATHSPILLSDIPVGNATFLERRFNEIDQRFYSEQIDVLRPSLGFTNTFAANIFDLYALPFFLNEGTLGRFAEQKVKQVLPGLNKNESNILPLKQRKKIAREIGDPFLREYYCNQLENEV